MKILYMHNYRGFQKTYVPLTDVTFLLGENSTGKTSVLSLIYLLSQVEFWYSSNFNLKEIELGFFNEILSSNATEPFFEVGFFNDAGKKGNFNACYMKFVENEENRYLEEMKFVLDNQTIWLFIEQGVVQKVVKSHTLPKSKEPINHFKHWIEQVKRNDADKTTTLGTISGRHFLNLYLIFENKVQNSRKTSDFRFAGLPPMTWIAPIRAKPKRYYEGYQVNFSAEGEHIPYLLKRVFQNDAHPLLRNELENFGIQSGLFEKIQIKTMSDDKNALFEIQIILNGKPLKITNVGYGVSQVLPILVEILAKKESTYFAIQQPEVHLHPKAQAMLGALFFHMALQEQKSFIIETHSDFIVDRYRLALRKNNKNFKTKVSNGQVLFFERTDKGNVIHVLPMDAQGDYPENQPDSFRDFFVKEELDMLSY